MFQTEVEIKEFSKTPEEKSLINLSLYLNVNAGHSIDYLTDGRDFS